MASTIALRQSTAAFRRHNDILAERLIRTSESRARAIENANAASLDAIRKLARADEKQIERAYHAALYAGQALIAAERTR